MSTQTLEKPKQTRAVAKAGPGGQIVDYLKSPGFREAIQQVLPKHCTPDRFVKVALTATMRVPKLAQCTKASLVKALMTCSELGLEPDGRRAHLIPYDDRKAGVTHAQLIVDYKGLVELIRRSGEVSDIHADVVCENDEFEENLGQVTKHRIDRRQPRGKPFAAYSRVTLKDGTVSCCVMGVDEIEAVRSRSLAGRSGPWVTDWPEMAKKTVFRRHSKWLPVSPEIIDATEVEDIDPNDHDARSRRAKPVFGADNPTGLDFLTEGPEYDPEAPDADPVEPGPEPDAPEGEPVMRQDNTNYVTALRRLAKLDGIPEGDVLTALHALGVDDSAASFEDVQQIAPRILKSAVESWDSFKGTVAMAVAEKGGQE